MFEIANLFACCFFVLIALWSIRREPRSLFPYLAILFVATNVVGLSFLRLPIVADLQYYGKWFQLEERPMENQFLAGWLFMAIMVAGLLCRPHILAEAGEISCTRTRAYKLVAAVFFGSLFLYSRFMFFGGNSMVALDTTFLTRSFDSMAAARKEISSLTEPGQGFMLASISAQLGFPLAASLASSLRLGWFARVIWFASAALSVLYAFYVRQKSPLLVFALMYGAMLINWPAVGLTLKFRRNALINSVLCCLWGGVILGLLAVLYSMTEGDDLVGGAIKSVSRIFFLPAFTSQGWFAIFPSDLDFRGLLGCFAVGLSPDDIRYTDISWLSSGTGGVWNACMLAVTWSGGGFWGVLLIGVLFVGLSLMADRILLRLSVKLHPIVRILIIPSLIPLTCGSISDYLMTGGGLVAIGVGIIAWFLGARRAAFQASIVDSEEVA